MVFRGVFFVVNDWEISRGHLMEISAEFHGAVQALSYANEKPFKAVQSRSDPSERQLTSYPGSPEG